MAMPPLLVVAVEFEGIDGTGLDQAALVRAALLLGLLVPEVLAPHLHSMAQVTHQIIRQRAVQPVPRNGCTSCEHNQNSIPLHTRQSRMGGVNSQSRPSK